MPILRINQLHEIYLQCGLRVRNNKPLLNILSETFAKSTKVYYLCSVIKRKGRNEEETKIKGT